MLSDSVLGIGVSESRRGTKEEEPLPWKSGQSISAARDGVLARLVARLLQIQAKYCAFLIARY